MNSFNGRVSRGALIIIEGCDRSGKTTQSKKLVEVLREKGIQAKHMSFPNREVNSGKLIDSYLKNSISLPDECIHLLFAANRWELAKSLENDLLSGTTIVVDRYSFSGIAYSVAKGMDFEWCKNPEKGLLKPDLVLYLKTSMDVLSKRKDFGGERYEKPDFQIKVADIFNQLCNEENSYCKEINADNSTIDELNIQLLKEAIIIVEKIREKPLQKLWL